MRDQFIWGSSIIGLLLSVGLVGCASPPKDATRLWVSTGGELVSFDGDERYCATEASTELDVPMDERLFAVCMYERGWRETGHKAPTLAAVGPIPSVRSKVNVRKHPSQSSQILAGLAAGERAQLLGREGDWYHVRLRSGEEGYVSARWIRRLN